ncbi:MAG: Flp pilus assembly protein CpaB [Acidobacteriaceae bacterium]
MNRRVLIGIIIAVVGIGLIALGILAINTVLKRSFTPQPQATPVVEATANIIITTHDLAVGAVINREDVQLATVPLNLVPRDAVLTIEESLGRITKVHLIQGEMVLQHHLADPTNVSHDIGYIIEDNQVLMAFPSTDLMSTLGVLQRGDTVDILASLQVEVTPTTVTPGTTTSGEQEEKITRLFTFDSLQRIEISAIVADVVNQSGSQTPTQGGAQPTPNPANIKVRAYLFALNAQDALVLKNLKDAGATFDIVLRSPTSNELFEVSPVTIEYIIQRYELQIPR